MSVPHATLAMTASGTVVLRSGAGFVMRLGLLHRPASHRRARGLSYRPPRRSVRVVVVSMVPILTVLDAPRASVDPSALHPERADLEDRARRALRGRGAAVGRDRGAQPPPPLLDRQHRDRTDRRPGGEARVGAGRPGGRVAGGAVRRQHPPARHSPVPQPEPEHPGAAAARCRDGAGGSGSAEARDPERTRRGRFSPDDSRGAAPGGAGFFVGPPGPRRGTPAGVGRGAWWGRGEILGGGGL